MRRRVGINLLSHLNSTHPNRSFPGKPLPSPLSSRPELRRSAAERSAVLHGDQSSRRAPPFPLSSRRSVPGFPTSRCWPRPQVRFSLRKPHDVNQGHGYRQEILGSAVERSAVLHGNQSSRRAPPFPLSSRPKRSAVERSAVLPATSLQEEHLPFPLSSRPKRSAVERSAVQRSLLGNVFSKGGSSRPSVLVIGVVVGCLFRRRLN
jgi:hypothetical protein